MHSTVARNRLCLCRALERLLCLPDPLAPIARGPQPFRQLVVAGIVIELVLGRIDLPRLRHDLLRPGFLEGGYQEAVLVTMLLARPSDRDPPAVDLVELGAAELGPTVEAYVRGGPGAEEESGRAGELCRVKGELGRNGVRFLAALVEGEVAGWCEVRRYEAGGQVEDVVVLEPFRGRGLARA